MALRIPASGVRPPPGSTSSVAPMPMASLVRQTTLSPDKAAAMRKSRPPRHRLAGSHGHPPNELTAGGRIHPLQTLRGRRSQPTEWDGLKTTITRTSRPSLKVVGGVALR
jgi:hypothetical protein